MQRDNRRIVTGLDDQGKSVVMIDDAGGPVTGASPTHVAMLWQTGEAPADNSGTTDAASSAFSFDFAPGASKCLAVTVEPTQDLMPPGMHATDTLDYVIMVEGRITLFLEQGSVELAPGDVAINRGIMHGWQNKGPEIAKMVVVGLDAVPVGPGKTWPPS